MERPLLRLPLRVLCVRVCVSKPLVCWDAGGGIDRTPLLFCSFRRYLPNLPARDPLTAYLHNLPARDALLVAYLPKLLPGNTLKSLIYKIFPLETP